MCSLIPLSDCSVQRQLSELAPGRQLLQVYRLAVQVGRGRRAGLGGGSSARLPDREGKDSLLLLAREVNGSLIVRFHLCFSAPPPSPGTEEDILRRGLAAAVGNKGVRVPAHGTISAASLLGIPAFLLALWPRAGWGGAWP